MSKELKKLEEQVARLEKENAAILKLKRPVKDVEIKATKTGGSEATAIVLLSDFHFEETVNPKSVFNRNRFDLIIAEQRIKETFLKVARLIKKEQQDVKITECIVGLLGDFITGAIHEENLETCALRPVEAVIRVRSLIHSGIVYLLANTDVNYTFVCAAGNHSRISYKCRSATEQGHSLEWFLYAQLANDFAAEKRVKFVMEEAYHTYLTVYGRVLRFHHGHHVRYAGGTGGITIPMNKAIAQWDTINRADISLCGHFHQFTLHNNFIVNGSLIGYNAYAVTIKASFERPKQAFVLLDKDRGLTVSIPIMYSV